MAQRSAIVEFKGIRAGLLEEVRGAGTRFIYDEEWNGEIACALPVTEREHRWPVGLHPVFEHLGAEGWLRGVQARSSDVDGEDDLGLLLTYGADCIGAIGVVPTGPLAAPPHPRSELEDAAVHARRSVSGVQRKLLAYRDGNGHFQPARLPKEPATYIAKFNSPDIPTLVQNEDLTLRLAREVLGTGEVTASAIATVAGVEGVALLAERFDRENGAKLRLEDFAQILGRPRGRDFKGKYVGHYEEIAQAIGRHSARPIIDLERFFRRLVFSLVVGDADAHLKNFSLLETPSGLRLSPAYDLLSTIIYDNYDRDTALGIDGRVRSLDSLDASLLTGFGQAIGLPRRAVEAALRRLAQTFARASALDAARRTPPQDFRARYAEIVDGQAQRILT